MVTGTKASPGIPDPVIVLKAIACYRYKSCEHLVGSRARQRASATNWSGASESLIGPIPPNRPFLHYDEPVKPQLHSGPVTDQAALGKKLLGVRNPRPVLNRAIGHPLHQLPQPGPEVQAHLFRLALDLDEPPFSAPRMSAHQISGSVDVHVET
jgi:hypothetical protein